MSGELLGWLVFGGAVFFLMGLGLALGAEGHARSARQWMRGPTGPAGDDSAETRRLVWSYRLGGAVFMGFGAWLLWGGFFFPARLAASYHPRPLTPLGKAAAGFFFFLCGSLLSAVKAADLFKPERDRKDKAVRWSGWLITLCFLAFGAYLLHRAVMKS